MVTNNPGADPVKVLAPTQTGSPPHDDHDTSGPPSAETIKRGYEEDKYDAKTVLSVPLLVILFFVLAFGTVTILFSFLAHPTVDPNANPQVKARNQADVNTRLGRIGRGKEVDQPRLDQADRLDSRYDPRVITRTKLKEGNSQHVHPEDLIPSKERYPDLYKTGDKQVSLEATMALSNDALKAKFKSSGPPLPNEASRYTPTGANAGRGAEESVAVPPRAPEVKEEPKKATEPAPQPKPKEEKK